jgi:flagellar L-ring protein precursor FlgH
MQTTMKTFLKNSAILACLVLTHSAQATSLFNDATYKPLAADRGSRNVGQSLTVLIFEQASAETSADTDTESMTDISASVGGNDNRNTGSLDLANNFEGGGSISRSGRLVASVTVTILDKLENGELVIGGEQLIEFNEENQHIRLSGRVRPEDISTNNTVLSTRVADAKITYIGDGLLGERQAPGILSRFFNWLW